MRIYRSIFHQGIQIPKIVFVALLIYANTAHGESTKDTSLVYLQFSMGLSDLKEKATSEDDLYFRLQDFQNTIFQNKLSDYQQRTFYSYFEQLFAKIKPNLQFRIEEVNWSIIRCLIGQRNLVTDSATIKEFNLKIIKLLEEGIEPLFEKYREESIFKPRLITYINEFANLDPANPILVRIEGMFKFHRIKYICLVFVLLVIGLIMRLTKKGTNPFITLSSKRYELSELLSISTFTLVLFSLFFMPENKFKTLYYCIGIILFCNVLTCLFFSLLRDKKRLTLNFNLSLIFFFLSISFFLWTGQYSFAIGVISVFLSSIIAIKNNNPINPALFSTLIFLVFSLFFYLNREDFLAHFLDKRSLLQIAPVLIASIVSLFQFTLFSTFRTVRVISLSFLAYSIFTLSIVNIPATNLISGSIGTGIFLILLFFIGLKYFVPTYQPLTIRKFKNRINLLASDKDKLKDYSGYVLKFAGEFCFDPAIIDVTIANEYFTNRTHHEQPMLKRLDKLVFEEVKDFPEVEKKSINFWLECVGKFLSISFNIPLIGFIIIEELYDEKHFINVLLKADPENRGNRFRIQYLYLIESEFKNGNKVLSEINKIDFSNFF